MWQQQSFLPENRNVRERQIDASYYGKSNQACSGSTIGLEDGTLKQGLF
jgi:hypothetical protein